MRYFQFVLLVVFACLFSELTAQQGFKQWHQAVKKMEKQYEKGVYNQAYSAAVRLEKVQRKKGVAANLLPVTKALIAKYANAKGKAIDATKTIFKADEEWQFSKQKLDSLGQITGNIYLADAWLSMSYTKNALNRLQEASALCAKYEALNKEFNQEVRYKSLEALIVRHDYDSALVLFNDVYEDQKKRSKRKQQRKNPRTGALELKNIKRKEWKKRKALGASLLLAQGEIYRLRGDIVTADSLFEKLNLSLKNYAKRNHFVYSSLHRNEALALEDKEEYAKASRFYKRARKKYAGKLSTSIPNGFYTAIFEDEIRADLAAGKKSKAKKAIKQFGREHLKRYGKNSTYSLETKRLRNKLEISDKKYVKALKRANRNIDDFTKHFPATHSGKIALLRQYKYLQVKNNNFTLAAQVQNQIACILDTLHGSSAPIYLEALLEQAELQTYYTFEFEEADSIYNQSFNRIAYANMHPYHNNYIPLLSAYTSLLIELDRYDSAMTLVVQAKNIAKEKYGEESVEYAQQLKLQADIHIIKGEFNEAETVLNLAVETIKDDKAKQSYAYYNALQTLGEIQNLNGKLSESKNTLNKAIRVAKKLGLNTEGLAASSTLELAELFIETGRYKEAQDLLVTSIELQSKKHGETYFQLVEPFAALGRLNLINGDFIEAERNVNEALKLTELTLSDTSRKYINNEVLLGDVYYSMGDYERAQLTYISALQKNTKTFGAMHIIGGDIMVKQARIQLALETQTDTILSTLDSAAEIIKSAVGDAHPKYASAMELKADVLLQIKEYDQALALLEKAQNIYVNVYGAYHVNTAKNGVRVANLYYRKEEYRTAEVLYKKTLKTFKKIFSDQHPEYTATLSKLGRSYYAEGDYKKSMETFGQTTTIYLEYIEKYFPSLTEKEKAKYWNKIRTDFEIFNSLATTYHEEKPELIAKMYNYKLATKALLLSSSIKVKQQILASGDADLMNKYNDWKVKREQLSLSLSLSYEEQVAKGIYPKDLEKEIALLEKELGERSSAFAKNNQQELFTWKDVKKTLKENEAAIEIIRFNYFNNNFTDSVIYAALIVTKESKKTPTLVELANGSELENKYFKYYRNVIKFKAKDKNSYSQFWEPIEKALSNKTTIYLSADGVYNQLNPETFRKEDGSYLIDKYNFYSVSNTKDLVLNDREEKTIYLTKNALMFGNPEFGTDIDSTLEASAAGIANKVSSVEPLPGAEEEVKSLSELLTQNQWNTQTYLTKNATENKVKAMNNPRIFHVATHGFFVEEETLSDNDLDVDEDKPTPNPLLKSGLLFVGADDLLAENNIFRFNKKEGVLTAYEAMNLSLDNTELVVLSACETGLGEVKSGEGVYGLQRSFLVAGAQNVVMTLFKVNDEVTQELMTSFYSEWLAKGDKRKAFLNAKMKIKEKYEAPIYWGSFVMIGLD